MSTEAFGMVGLGAMGGPMTEKALEAGFTVHVYDKDPTAVDRLVALGAKAEANPAAVASQVEVVFVSLPTAAIVEAVALGPQGIIEGTRIKHYIDASTTGPTVARKVGRALTDRGVSALDAPVSGGPMGINAGTLAVIAAGPEETLARAEVFLKAFSSKIVHISSEIGKAQTVKLANNLMLAASMVITGEAMAFAEKNGIDPEALFNVVNSGSGRSWASEVAYAKHVATRRYDQNFRTELMHKDVALCLQEAERVGVPMWLGANVRQFWQFAMTQGMGPQDCSRIAPMIERWAGLEPEDKSATAAKADLAKI